MEKKELPTISMWDLPRRELCKYIRARITDWSYFDKKDEEARRVISLMDQESLERLLRREPETTGPGEPRASD